VSAHSQTASWPAAHAADAQAHPAQTAVPSHGCSPYCCSSTHTVLCSQGSHRHSDNPSCPPSLELEANTTATPATGLAGLTASRQVLPCCSYHNSNTPDRSVAHQPRHVRAINSQEGLTALWLSLAPAPQLGAKLGPAVTAYCCCSSSPAVSQLL
jgi:hypothetical protein